MTFVNECLGSQGRTQDFLKGADNFWRAWWPVECEKSTLHKLFIILQASSVLSQSKKQKKNRLQSCKSRNLTEETLKI